jgi:outer membrane protein assembly factor BamE (lipoprotein component of BamABCDE complex)
MQLSAALRRTETAPSFRGFPMIVRALKISSLARVWARFVAVAAIAGAAAACNPITDNLGNRTLKENVEQIQVGRTSKAEAARLLGTPSNVAAFDPDTWYYISARQVQYAFLKPRTVDQNVLVIRFDGAGLVREMKQLGMEDAQATTYVARTTPTRGGEPGFLRAIYDTIMRGPVGRQRQGSPRGPTE